MTASATRLFDMNRVAVTTTIVVTLAAAIRFQLGSERNKDISNSALPDAVGGHSRAGAANVRSLRGRWKVVA
jgi:nanoRNase/pAp phosphatase (c-di-AMP/oligoRNAs hydrolase)